MNPDIKVPDEYKHLLKGEAMSRGADDVASRKRRIIEFCTDVPRTREAIEHFVGYKKGSGGPLIRQLVQDRKLFKAGHGQYKAVVIDQEIVEKRSKTWIQINQIEDYAKDFIWASGEDPRLVKRFVGYLKSKVGNERTNQKA